MWMAAQCLLDQTGSGSALPSVEEIQNLAVQRKFSANGEMFRQDLSLNININQNKIIVSLYKLNYINWHLKEVSKNTLFLKYSARNLSYLFNEVYLKRGCRAMEGNSFSSDLTFEKLLVSENNHDFKIYFYLLRSAFLQLHKMNFHY